MKSILITCCIILTLLQSFIVNAQHRKVLIEQFTNSGCPPCAGNTPVVAAYVNSHPDTALMIAYHTSFPYQDSMYYENPNQSNNRVAFYNVVGVPRSIVDGNYFSGNLLSSISTTIMTRAMVQPRYLINFISATLNGTQVELTVSFESTNAANQNESLVAHVVLVEKNVLKSAYVCCAGANTETEYPWVMRKMIPDEFGTPLINKYTGGIDLLTLSANANNYKDLSELRIITFIQNTNTKEIYQSEISQPVTLSSITENMINGTEIFQFKNPVYENDLNIFFNKDDRNYLLEISDMHGRNIYSENSNYEKLKSIDVSGYRSGMYFISVTANGVNEVKKLVVLK